MHFGSQKINLHRAGHEFEPKAAAPTPGSAALCFLTSVPVETVAERLARLSIAVIEGPVHQTGATGPLRSVYVRDPDGHRIELYCTDYQTLDPAHAPLHWDLADPQRQTLWGAAAPRSCCRCCAHPRR